MWEAGVNDPVGALTGEDMEDLDFQRICAPLWIDGTLAESDTAAREARRQMGDAAQIAEDALQRTEATTPALANVLRQTEDDCRRLSQTIENIRRTKSYRIGRLFRMLTSVVRTRNPRIYASFALGMVRRLLGHDERLAQFAPENDHAECLQAMAQQHLENVRQCCLEAEAGLPDEARGELLLSVIQAVRKAGGQVICVMAPMFTGKNVKDGYFRRVQAIDELMDRRTLRIYMSAAADTAEGNRLRLRRHDERHIEARYVRSNECHRRIVLEIVKAAGIAYHHSVTYIHPDVMECPDIVKIVDLHGTRPEELILYGNKPQAELESSLERLAVEHATVLVAVTKAFKRHINAKYPAFDPPFIFLPILDSLVQEASNASPADQERPYADGRPIVVYAGGMQRWQMVDAMQDAMKKTRDRYAYEIYTPDQEEFWAMWGDRKRPRTLKVDTCSPAELMDIYRRCHYGFLLREDTPINNVACPTKLIEYLATGVVPVLHSEKVGDFIADGMRYIPLEDFISGKIPSEAERLAIVRGNLTVIDRILERYQEGKRQLRELFAAYRSA